MEYSKEDLMEAKRQILGVGENMGTEESKKIWEKNAQFWDDAMGDESNEFHREVVRPKVSEKPYGSSKRKWREWHMRNNRLLPYETIVQAASGEPEAVGTVLQYYRRRIQCAARVNGRVDQDTLLREFVEKIVVHECSYDENKTRRQDIEIYYSFVGKVDLPE